jgi:uncharacterized protein YbjT (DUF2867 family)
VVAFDLDEPQTHGPAFEGAYGVYVVTSFWEHMDPQKEIDQAAAIAKAAEAAGVKHIVWSTLENTADFYDGLPEKDRVPKINGYYVPHFDAKGLANDKFPKKITTYFHTCFYSENFYNLAMVANGTLTNNLGESKLALIGSEDIGKCAYGVFKGGDKFKGKKVYVAGDILTCAEIMEICSKVTGKKFTYNTIDRDTYAGFGFPGADDLANMFHYYAANEKSFNRNRDVAASKALNSELQSFEQWAKTHKTELTGLAAKD